MPAPRFCRLILLLALLIGDIAAPSRAQQQNRFGGQVVAVESGDLVRVQLDQWQVNVRLHGIECPQTPPALRDRAREYTARLVQGTPIRVEVRGTGSRQTVYGEVVAADGRDVNRALARAGLAVWARQYAPGRDDIAALEAEAKAAKRGLWGSANGTDVPLPPSLAGTLRREHEQKAQEARLSAEAARKKAAETAEARRRAAIPPPASSPPAKVIARPPAPRPSAVRPAPLRTTPAPPPAQTAGATERLRTLQWMTFSVLFVATALLLFRGSGGNVRCLPAQALAGGVVGMGGALALPFPFLLLRGNIPAAAWVTLAVTPLCLLALYQAARLWQTEGEIRARPRSLQGGVAPGFAKIYGTAGVRPGDALVFSDTGRVPGLWVREVVRRFDAQVEERFDWRTLRKRRRMVPRWQTLKDETRAVPSLLLHTDGGVVAVEAAPTDDVRPCHVARFYNDVPMQSWHFAPNAGDVRTEVFFIPPNAGLTAWGRLYATGEPSPVRAEYRLVTDPLRQRSRLLLLDGGDKRLYSRRALPTAFLLTFAAIALGGVIAQCIVTPGAFR